MQSMKAAVYDHYGGPDVVRVAEVARPRTAGNELLVKVATATVNRTDRTSWR